MKATALSRGPCIPGCDMETILKALHELAGVHAIIVFDVGGKVVAHGGHAVYDKPLLDQVAGTLVKAIDSIQLQHADWDGIAAQYADGKLLLRNLGTLAGTAYVLALVSDSTLNISFAAVAMRVAATKLKKALEGGSHPPGAQAPTPLQPPTLLRGVTPSPMPVASPTPVDGSPLLATSGLSWSKVGSSGIGISSIAVVNQAASAYLTRCSKELARYVGPMAKVFIKESLRRLSPGAPFALSLAPQLVAALSEQIDDPNERITFRNALEKI
jgi:predicted regulator of Ras-like GTPase activity (Roadblock/LC7/MglB family)